MTIFIKSFFKEISKISKTIDIKKIDKMVIELSKVRKRNGRVFCIGIGGSAANCSHLVNDLRKLCLIDAITPMDNTSELTARINDDGWNTSILNSLKVSQITSNDIIFVLSVGGGSLERKISLSIVSVVKHCLKNQIKVIGIVGKKNGYTYKNGNFVVSIPVETSSLVTPISESFQSIVWHSIVSDPRLQLHKTKW
jgi:D-sedoheptulose 7-phosphate isomerase|tara:strand:+ start:1543 stop:2130 length:588 start_codon:yes stop_codon:yes gene_type:complete